MTQPQRWRALDAFRGLTIAGMILVNNPAKWEYTLDAFKHAHWDGCTLADLVFPFFLFVVGITTAISLAGAKAKGAVKGELLLKALRRALILIGIGLALNFIHQPSFAEVRIPGVLQRIGVVYFICSLFYLYSGPAVWVGYIVLSSLLAFYLTYEQLAPGGLPWHHYLDSHAFGSHVYGETAPADAEGLFSTITSISTGLLGMLVGRWRLANSSTVGVNNLSSRFIIRLLQGAFVLGGIGLLLDFGGFYPMNKTLWTPAFVFFTAGLGMALLAAFTRLEAPFGHTMPYRTLVALGLNPIIIYVGAELAAYLLGIKWADGLNTRKHLYQGLDVFMESHLATLAYSVGLVLLWAWVAWQLNKRRVFVKI